MLLLAISGGQENKLFVLFAGVSIRVQVECRAGLCIAVSARPCGPGTISNEQPTQAELTGPVTEVRTPGTEVVVGYGTAAWLVRQGYRIYSGLTGISRNMAHQLSACCICSAITHRARFSLMSPSMPLTARVWLRLPFAVRPGSPPFSKFSWIRWYVVHRSSLRSS